MIFIQRSAGRSDSIVQQTNNFNQRRKGNLGRQNCSNREHEYIHRPNVVKTCFTCRRYTVKSHAGGNQQHAYYSIQVVCVVKFCASKLCVCKLCVSNVWLQVTVCQKLCGDNCACKLCVCNILTDVKLLSFSFFLPSSPFLNNAGGQSHVCS